MALERRGRGVYSYTSERVGRRVVKRYGGSGRLARLAAKYAAQRELRRIERSQPRLGRAFADAEYRAQRDWLHAVTAVVEAALERAGWHKVRRQWRKKRGQAVTALTNVAELSWVSADLVVAAGSLDPETAKKAEAGDKASYPAVDAFLENPAARALWGDWGRHVLNSWAKLYAGTNELMRQGVLRFASDLRAALAGPTPTALERIVAERVVLGWLFANWCEVQYAQQVGQCDLTRNAFHLKRIDLANRNLLSACRTLAKVKRANLPDVLALVNMPPACELPSSDVPSR